MRLPVTIAMEIVCMYELTVSYDPIPNDEIDTAFDVNSQLSDRIDKFQPSINGGSWRDEGRGVRGPIVQRMCTVKPYVRGSIPFPKTSILPSDCRRAPACERAEDLSSSFFLLRRAVTFFLLSFYRTVPSTTPGVCCASSRGVSGFWL